MDWGDIPRTRAIEENDRLRHERNKIREVGDEDREDKDDVCKNSLERSSLESDDRRFSSYYEREWREHWSSMESVHDPLDRNEEEQSRVDDRIDIDLRNNLGDKNNTK